MILLWVYAHINNLLLINLLMALMIELDELYKLEKHIHNISKIRKKNQNRNLLQRSKFVIIF